MMLVIKGDAKSTDILIQRYQNSLFHFIYRLVLNQADAEDLFQESWLRVIRYRDTYNSEKKFSTWLFQIALNCTRSFMKQKKASISIENVAINAIDPDHTLEKKEMAHKLTQQLPLHQREPLILKFFHGKKEREIADILAIPIGTVKSRLHKALQHLKNYYGSEYATALDG